MKIKQFEVAGLAQYSYVLSSEGEAIVIDPMRDFDRYTVYAHEQELSIKYVTETHVHADFASGALALAEATGAELALSAYDKEPYHYSMEHRSCEVPKGAAIIVVCGSGYRSSIAASLLQAAGFASVSSMDGGHDGLEETALANCSSLKLFIADQCRCVLGNVLLARKHSGLMPNHRATQRALKR